MSATFPLQAKADLKLPRERVTLVSPPFVHAHEDVTKSGSKIIEFKMTVVEKPVVIDEVGTKTEQLSPIVPELAFLSNRGMNATRYLKSHLKWLKLSHPPIDDLHCALRGLVHD